MEMATVYLVMHSMENNPGFLTQEQINTKDIYELKRGLAGLTDAINEEHTDSKAFRDEIRPLLEIYNGGKFARSFIIGVGTLVGSIVAIGVGMYTLLQWIRHIN